jgi:chemotaxis response regulator CheB
MPPIKPLLLGLGLFALAGCDTAEQAASDFAEKVEQAAVDQVKESLGETLKELDEQVEQLNDKVDQAQESSREWLNQAKPASAPEQPGQQPKQDMIET